MIVVDTSAIVAIVEREADAAIYADALEAAEAVCMSAASLVELAVVLLRRRGEAGWTIGQRFVNDAAIEVRPVTAALAVRAIEAYRRYGGRIGLNVGDCFSYALAIEEKAPLLFKGADFARTDVARCT